MKKYIASILIPPLLLYLSGCYSMQKVTKDEFLQESDYPELMVKTNEKKSLLKRAIILFRMIPFTVRVNAYY